MVWGWGRWVRDRRVIFGGLLGNTSSSLGILGPPSAREVCLGKFQMSMLLTNYKYWHFDILVTKVRHLSNVEEKSWNFPLTSVIEYVCDNPTGRDRKLSANPKKRLHGCHSRPLCLARVVGFWANRVPRRDRKKVFIDWTVFFFNNLMGAHSVWFNEFEFFINVQKAKYFFACLWFEIAILLLLPCIPKHSNAASKELGRQLFILLNPIVVFFSLFNNVCYYVSFVYINKYNQKSFEFLLFFVIKIYTCQ